MPKPDPTPPTPSREAREVAERVWDLSDEAAYGPLSDPANDEWFATASMEEIGAAAEEAKRVFTDRFATLIEAYARRKLRDASRGQWRRCPCGTEDVHDPLLGRETECRHCMARRKVREALEGAARVADEHVEPGGENDLRIGRPALIAQNIRALIPKEQGDG